MSFQAYLDNIHAKTGVSPAEFKKFAAQKGFLTKGKLTDGIKGGDVLKWLKEDYQLGHGHAMALFALFKGMKKEGLINRQTGIQVSFVIYQPIF